MLLPRIVLIRQLVFVLMNIKVIALSDEHT